jgi:glycosyltransferase involved in cell wall biosynthesis
MLTIGVDGRATEPGFKAHYGRGTGRYASELVRRLLTINDEQLRVTPFRTEHLRGQGWEDRLIRALPFGKQTAETQLFLPKRLRRLDCDLLHFLAHGDATARCAVPYLVTVLDLIPLKFPDLYKADRPDWRFKLARRLEQDAIRQAAGILAISEATKRDVVDILGIAPEKIIVTPLGVGEQFTSRSPISSEWQREARLTKEKFSLPPERPLLLYAGGIDPRKNILFLLSVFAELLKYPLLQRPCLALVGAYDADLQYPRLLAKIKELNIEDDVRLLGFVSDADLPSVYRAADLKLFPSLYEGFGLPVLEAMACGVPVVAGANSSLPEVAGNAAVLVKDSDQDAWVSEIVALLINQTRQGQLIQAGKAQARKFTWDHTAQSTFAAYRFFTHRDTAAELPKASVAV